MEAIGIILIFVVAALATIVVLTILFRRLDNPKPSAQIPEARDLERGRVVADSKAGGGRSSDMVILGAAGVVAGAVALSAIDDHSSGKGGCGGGGGGGCGGGCGGCGG